MSSSSINSSNNSGGGGRGGRNYDLSHNDYRKVLRTKIIEADYCTRPGNFSSSNGVGGSINHHGVSLRTEENRNFLIHSTPEKGTVCTETPMSGRWTVDHKINIKGDKTVGDVMKEAVGGYYEKFTCIGAARDAERALKK